MSNRFFEQIGGRPALEKINRIFYDKVFAHPWLSQYFVDIGQDTIESQQTDFLQSTFGGPRVYCGRLPVPAHQHIYITEELFDLRSSLLEESLREYGLDEKLIVHWMKIDGAFRSVLVKKSASECRKRYNTDRIKDYPDPGAARKKPA